MSVRDPRLELAFRDCTRERAEPAHDAVRPDGNLGYRDRRNRWGRAAQRFFLCEGHTGNHDRRSSGLRVMTSLGLVIVNRRSEAESADRNRVVAPPRPRIQHGHIDNVPSRGARDPSPGNARHNRGRIRCEPYSGTLGVHIGSAVSSQDPVHSDRRSSTNRRFGAISSNIVVIRSPNSAMRSFPFRSRIPHGCHEGVGAHGLTLPLWVHHDRQSREPRTVHPIRRRHNCRRWVGESGT